MHIWTNGNNVVEYEGQCFNLDSASNMGFNPESIYQMTTVEGTMKSDEKYISIDSIGTKNIAGKTTDCYEIVYKTSQYNQLTTYCLSPEGIPALIEAENKDTGELISKVEAKTLEDSIDESVLEPCEPNVDLSSYM